MPICVTKISHRDPVVVSRVISQIESKFGKMTVTRGKMMHSFLRMDLRYNSNGSATISMRAHINDAIAGSGLGISKSVSTPARHFLFDVDETSPRLIGTSADNFHSTSTAKLLAIHCHTRAYGYPSASLLPLYSRLKVHK